MDIDLASAYEALKNGLVLLKDALSVAKGAKDLLPSGKDRDNIESTLEAADRSMKLAEVQIAQALGYRLCRCTFPPQIMLSQGPHDKCPNCGKIYPPPDAGEGFSVVQL